MLSIAYGGFSDIAVANTLTAYRRAAQAGCHCIYADVRLSADGVPFCLADPALGKISGQRGWVHLMDASALARVGIISRAAGRGDEKIVPLGRLLQFAMDEGLGVIVNLPAGSSPRWQKAAPVLANRTLEFVDSLKARPADLRFMASDPRVLRPLLDQSPWPVGAKASRYREALAWLEWPDCSFILACPELFFSAYRPRQTERLKQAGLDLLEAARSGGRGFFVGPLSRRDEVESLLPLRPDGILGPNPALLAELGLHR